MADEQTSSLSLKAAYAFGAANGLAAEMEEIRSMEIEWDKPYTSSLRRGYVVALLEEKGLYEKFKQENWRNGNTSDGERSRRWYLKLRSRHEEFLAGPVVDPVEDESESDQRFAAETDLRDFLAQNPSCIEKGLTVYQSGDRSGVEFTIDDGRIDILAVDKADKFVVVELKVGRGRNKTIGQLLYYMGWVDQHLGRGPCRGIIIAKDISDDLILAVKRVPGVSLCRYRLTVSIESITNSA